MSEAAVQLEQIDDDALKHALWRRGELSWKLDAHQKRAYDKYRAWEQRVVEELKAARIVANHNATQQKRGKRGLVRCFVFDIGRRWGKTFLVCLIRIEDCLRRRGLTITYATAFEKDIEEIIQPMIQEIIADAPPDVEPRFVRG